jgi:hypothetical protein
MATNFIDSTASKKAARDCADHVKYSPNQCEACRPRNYVGGVTLAAISG